jgi:ATP-dependent Lon protease
MGIKELILPYNNARNLKEDIPEPMLQELTFHLVSTIEEALQIALPDKGKLEQEVRAELEVKVPSS